MRTPGGVPIFWPPFKTMLLTCERCGAERWQLYVTPWGLLCVYCQSFATEWRVT